MGDALAIPHLQRSYRDGHSSPTEVISRLYPALSAEEGIFVTLAPLFSLLERCR